MKNIVLFSVIIFLTGATTGLSAQTVTSQTAIGKADTYSADSCSVSGNGNFLTFEGNVALTSGKLIISKADKVIIDKDRNLIKVYGKHAFSFNGKIVVVPTADNRHTVFEYTPGEDVAYIK
jgi:lipopolysaccharide export system protein LptA